MSNPEENIASTDQFNILKISSSNQTLTDSPQQMNSYRNQVSYDLFSHAQLEKGSRAYSSSQNVSTPQCQPSVNETAYNQRHPLELVSMTFSQPSVKETSASQRKAPEQQNKAHPRMKSLSENSIVNFREHTASSEQFSVSETANSNRSLNVIRQQMDLCGNQASYDAFPHVQLRKEHTAYFSVENQSIVQCETSIKEAPYNRRYEHEDNLCTRKIGISNDKETSRLPSVGHCFGSIYSIPPCNQVSSSTMHVSAESNARHYQMQPVLPRYFSQNVPPTPPYKEMSPAINQNYQVGRQYVNRPAFRTDSSRICSQPPKNKVVNSSCVATRTYDNNQKYFPGQTSRNSLFKFAVERQNHIHYERNMAPHETPEENDYYRHVSEPRIINVVQESSYPVSNFNPSDRLSPFSNRNYATSQQWSFMTLAQKIQFDHQRLAFIMLLQNKRIPHEIMMAAIGRRGVLGQTISTQSSSDFLSTGCAIQRHIFQYPQSFESRRVGVANNFRNNFSCQPSESQVLSPSNKVTIRPEDDCVHFDRISSEMNSNKICQRKEINTHKRHATERYGVDSEINQVHTSQTYQGNVTKRDEAHASEISGMDVPKISQSVSSLVSISESGVAEYRNPQRVPFPIAALNGEDKELMLNVIQRTTATHPQGIDPVDILNFRENTIASRMASRVQELSSLSNDVLTIATKTELLGMKLFDFQRQLRAEVVSKMRSSSLLGTSFDAKLYIRTKQQCVKEAREIDELENRKRLQNEENRKSEYQEY